MNSYKGMIFCGCSFTWGQGLYYYSGLESLKYSGNNFKQSDLTKSQIRYMQSKRFARTVANHFDTFEIVKDSNGGSDKSNILEFFEKIGKLEDDPFSDYSHFILQLTDPHRSWTEFEYNGKKIRFNPFLEDSIYNSGRESFFNWLLERNMNIKDWCRIHVKENLSFVKEKLEYFETQGIKTYLMTWPEVYLDGIFEDKFLKNRLITFSHQNIIFNSLESLMVLPGMKISTDSQNLKIKIADDHPSMECHKIIADSTIKKILSCLNQNIHGTRIL